MAAKGCGGQAVQRGTVQNGGCAVRSAAAASLFQREAHLFTGNVDQLSQRVYPRQLGHGAKATLRPEGDAGGRSGYICNRLYLLQKRINFRLRVPIENAVAQHGIGIVRYAAVPVSALDPAYHQVHVGKFPVENIVKLPGKLHQRVRAFLGIYAGVRHFSLHVDLVVE